MSLDVDQIRTDFPILQRTIHNRPLVYLDNAATTQKPRAVIEALVDYYEHHNANIHRGLHTLAEEATNAYEAVRHKAAAFVNAPGSESVIFTRNTTESINLVANAWGRRFLRPGDEILLTVMEHHSNLVPWQLVAQATGAVLKFVDIDEEGRLVYDSLQRLVTDRTKVLAVAHMSNVLGTVNQVRAIADVAHAAGAVVVVDGAQSVPHLPVDFHDLGADFLAFSSHKMLGPTGVGVLIGKPDLLDAMDPFLAGGEMIRKVTLESSTWNSVPWKYEAGTPNIADVIAFGAALDYLTGLGMENVRAHEVELVRYALAALGEVPDLVLYGPRDPAARGGVVAFNLGDIHPHDVSQVLDRYGVAIRAGHHCAQPLMRRLDTVATARASFYIYNRPEDVDVLVEGLHAATRMFGHVVRSGA